MSCFQVTLGNLVLIYFNTDPVISRDGDSSEGLRLSYFESGNLLATCLLRLET